METLTEKEIEELNKQLELLFKEESENDKNKKNWYSDIRNKHKEVVKDGSK